MGDIITNSGLFSKEAIVGQVSTTWILLAVLVILSICATSKLKTAGAEGILVLDIEKMIL